MSIMSTFKTEWQADRQPNGQASTQPDRLTGWLAARLRIEYKMNSINADEKTFGDNNISINSELMNKKTNN